MSDARFDYAGTLGEPGLVDGAAIHGIVQGALLAPSERVGEGSGACGSAGSAEGGDDRQGKLSFYTLKAIETQAEAAAKEGRAPVDACSWPFQTRESAHWLAVYVIAGGAL